MQRSPSVEGRYPCENCACGCTSAEFCWDKCCCHTDAEKLRWANDNGVTPPGFLVDRVKKSTFMLASLLKSPAKSCCSCGKVSLSSNCDEQTTQADTKPITGTSPEKIRIICLDDAAKCRGLQWIWSIFASGTIEQAEPVQSKMDAPFLFCLMISNDHAVSRSDTPDPPVPWRVAA